MHNETFPEPQDNFNETPIVQPSGLENPSRRGFLKRAGAMALGAATIGSVGNFVRTREAEYQDAKEEKATSELIIIRERLRAEYGIEIDFSPTSEMEHADGARGKAIESAVEKLETCVMIENTLMQYPPMMYKKRAIISRIRVLNNFDLEGKPNYAGYASADTGDIFIEHKEHRHQPGLIVTKGDNTEEFQSRLHHELEHMIDSVDEERWIIEGRALQNIDKSSDEYPYLLYVNELAQFIEKENVGDIDAKNYTERFFGFARGYGKSSAIEDRATIVESLYLSGEYITRRLPDDPPLARKVAFMKKEYFGMSRGVMDDKYWEVVMQHKDNPKMIAEYVKLQSARLLHMSDEELIAHAQTQKITLAAEDLKTWRDEIALGVPKEAQQ